jgi:hypothetical protein
MCSATVVEASISRSAWTWIGLPASATRAV